MTDAPTTIGPEPVRPSRSGLPRVEPDTNVGPHPEPPTTIGPMPQRASRSGLPRVEPDTNVGPHPEPPTRVVAEADILPRAVETPWPAEPPTRVVPDPLAGVVPKSPLPMRPADSAEAETRIAPEPSVRERVVPESDLVPRVASMPASPASTDEERALSPGSTDESSGSTPAPVPLPLSPRQAPASTRRPLLLGTSIAAVVLLGLGAVVWLKEAPPPPAPPRPGECEDLEALMRVARAGFDDRALAAAEKVVACEPIHEEGNARLKAIRVDRLSGPAHERGMAMARMQQYDDALALFAQVDPTASMFRDTQSNAREIAVKQLKKHSDDCRRYVKDRKWPQAEEHCRIAMDLKCQSMTRDELTPPPGDAAKTWKPVEPLQALLLEAKQNTGSASVPWVCKRLPMLEPLTKPVDATQQLKSFISTRVKDPALAEALNRYAKGKTREAMNELLEVKEKSSLADLHGRAEAMRKDIAMVDTLMAIGQNALGAQQLEKAAASYREAMALDEKLMLGGVATTDDERRELDRSPSEARRSMRIGMARTALDVGRMYASRDDWRRGCAAYRTGFGFYRGNQDLNAAVSECSQQASAQLETASSCEQLERASALMVDGDGVQSRYEQKKHDIGCETPR